MQDRFKELIAQAAAGDPEAEEALFPIIHDMIRQLAHHHIRKELLGHTWQTTDLAHEAYIKLCGRDRLPVENRRFLYGRMATAIRHLLVDHARRRNREVHGGGKVRVDVDPDHLAGPSADRSDPVDILSLNDALDRLEAKHPRAAQVVQLRFFTGLQEKEIATLLGLGLRTIQIDWQKARTFLHRSMSLDSAEHGGASSD